MSRRNGRRPRGPRRPVLTGRAAFPALGREPVVAVLVEAVFPAAITIEVLDAVTDEMGVDITSPRKRGSQWFKKAGRQSN